MTIYAAAFSLKELSYDDFFFLLAHNENSGIKSFTGAIDFIRIRTQEGAHAYLFRGMAPDIEVKDLAIVLMFSHDSQERDVEEHVQKMQQYEEAITVFVSTLAVVAEPNDLESFICKNGNAVTVLKDINMQKVADLFANGARRHVNLV